MPAKYISPLEKYKKKRQAKLDKAHGIKRPAGKKK
jgi:hypothetical protein